MKLTVKKIARLKEPGTRHGDGHGLALQITATGVKSWVFRYERGGRERMLGLGPLYDVSLADAREKARAAREQLRAGIDPIEARKAQKAADALEEAKRVTFKEAAETFFEQQQVKWKNARHRQQWRNTLEAHVFSRIGALSVADVDQSAVLKCIEPIWKTTPETANRIRGRIESILDWAKVRGYRAGENPARWRGHLEYVLVSRNRIAAVKHFPALPVSEMPAFMSELRGRPGIGARALEFCVLTAARTSEVTGARWDEIDFAAKTWTVPASRMKGGREHRVPLSKPALELLQRLPRQDGTPFVFVSGTPGIGLSNMAMGMILRRMGRGHVTVHGTARSTFTDWAHEMSAFPKVVIDMALAHAVGDKVEASYRRGDLYLKRARLMEEWSRYCAAPARGSGEIVPLSRARG
jgi:integrase